MANPTVRSGGLVSLAKTADSGSPAAKAAKASVMRAQRDIVVRDPFIAMGQVSLRTPSAVSKAAIMPASPST